MVNPYPYFGYSPEQANFALFKPNSGLHDKYTKQTYMNMIDLLIDAVHISLKKLGYGDVEIAVGETGWASAGENFEPKFSVKNQIESTYGHREIDLELRSRKDLLLKGYGEDGVETELMRLHNLCAPTRFFFTVKEESKEDLESDDGNQSVVEIAEKDQEQERNNEAVDVEAFPQTQGCCCSGGGKMEVGLLLFLITDNNS
ncbi:Glucan endo-1 [Forsythia ovata]|uniref:Glucan endo-1 n=1 Tax=Forsythia ovata TaxID=205694 RepID=A0ABD1PKK0_9LAMI